MTGSAARARSPATRDHTGLPRLADEHSPPRPPGCRPRAASVEEAAFLAIGPEASKWLTGAAAVVAPQGAAQDGRGRGAGEMHGAGEGHAALEAAAD